MTRYLEEEIQNCSLVARGMRRFHGDPLLNAVCLLLDEKHLVDVLMHLLVGHVDTELSWARDTSDRGQRPHRQLTQGAAASRPGGAARVPGEVADIRS